MKTQMSDKSRNMTMAAMFAALIALTILYLFHIPVGSNGGYVHFGDAFIYLAGCFLPMPYACAAAAIGGGIADLMSGAAVWMIPTMIIKPLMAMCFTNKGEKIFNTRNVIGVFLGGLINMVGYYVAECLMVGNWTSPLVGILPGLVQPGGSAILFLVMALAIDKLSLKKRLAIR